MTIPVIIETVIRTRSVDRLLIAYGVARGLLVGISGWGKNTGVGNLTPPPHLGAESVIGT